MKMIQTRFPLTDMIAKVTTWTDSKGKPKHASLDMGMYLYRLFFLQGLHTCPEYAPFPEVLEP